MFRDVATERVDRSMRGRRAHPSLTHPLRRESHMEALESRTLLAATVSTPFLGAPFKPGQVIEAENYDLGGSNVAYYMSRTFKVPANKYRPADATGIQPGGSNGYDMGYTTVGEWLQYSITIPTAGTFTLSTRVAVPATGGAFHATVDSVNVTGTLNVPDTGGWGTYQTVVSADFKLTAGPHKLRIYFDRKDSLGAVGNFDWFELSTVAVKSPALSLTWNSAASIPQAITEGEGATVNGKLYVFSGFNNTNYYPTSRVYCYDPTTNLWTRMADMPVPVTNTQAAAYGNDIYIAGGYPPNASHTAQAFSTSAVWRFDTVADSWTAMPSLPAPRGTGNVVMIGSLLHYISGGNTARVDQPQQWVLDVNNLGAGWVAKASIPVPINRAGAVALNGLIYVIGGDIGQDGTTQTLVQVYNPVTNTWSKAASLPVPKSRTLSSCTVYDGRIIVAGGGTPSSTTSEVDCYDPTTNTWTKLTALPSPRAGGICQAIGGMLVFTTGHFGFNANTWIGTFS